MVKGSKEIQAGMAWVGNREASEVGFGVWVFWQDSFYTPEQSIDLYSQQSTY